MRELTDKLRSDVMLSVRENDNSIREVRPINLQCTINIQYTSTFACNDLLLFLELRKAIKDFGRRFGRNIPNSKRKGNLNF